MQDFLFYIKFLLKSTNQHGIHSPFVYQLVTRCFYNTSMNKSNNITAIYIKDKKLSNKQANFINKLINYFEKDSEGFSFQKGNILKSNNGKFDLIYFNTPDQFDFNMFETLFHTNQMVLINNIYNSKKQNEVWKTITKHSLVPVSIDVYFFGLLFFRKEQAKEHFIIRS